MSVDVGDEDIPTHLPALDLTRLTLADVRALPDIVLSGAIRRILGSEDADAICPFGSAT